MPSIFKSENEREKKSALFKMTAAAVAAVVMCVVGALLGEEVIMMVHKLCGGEMRLSDYAEKALVAININVKH